MYANTRCRKQHSTGIFYRQFGHADHPKRRDVDQCLGGYWQCARFAGDGDGDRPGLHVDEHGTVVVGGLGTGTLTIQDGGVVNSGGGGSVGLSAGSTGTVTVTGPGSTWNNSPGGGLNIGSFGTGSLTIANGGMVINTTPFSQHRQCAGSQGTVTVTGAESTWTNSSGSTSATRAGARSRLRTVALSTGGFL